MVLPTARAPGIEQSVCSRRYLPFQATRGVEMSMDALSMPVCPGLATTSARHDRQVRSRMARVADRRSCRSEGDGDMSEDPGRSYRESVVTAGEPPETAAAAVRLGFALRRL